MKLAPQAWPRALALPLVLVALMLSGCGSTDPAQFDHKLQLVNESVDVPDPLAHYAMTGDLTPVRDPSIIHVGGTYYLFSTDIYSGLSGNHLPIRCSADMLSWKSCGYVFADRPQWVKNRYPDVQDLWAPDISYFNGLYHLYYSVNIFETHLAAIGMATNTTLDPGSSDYRWVDHGEILTTDETPNVTAIDPNIAIDDDGKVWLSYGSYNAGLFQREVDASTGQVVPGGTVYHLAERPGTYEEPIEATSIIHHGKYFYLFASADFCCTPNPDDSNYKEVMGRSLSIHGPFLTMQGDSMLQGYATVILSKNASWLSAGGGTAYIDPGSGDTSLAFHAFNRQAGDAAQLWVKHLTWQDDWPLLK